MPLDLGETLRSIGAFRLLAPQSHDGLELDLPTALRVISAAARIEGSVGWTMMTSNGGHLFATVLPRETYDKIYENGPDVIFAGSAQPGGTAELVTGGWRVSGRWPFASGCQHADWMLGMCIMAEGGHPIPGEGGAPLIRGFVLPARDWCIE